MKKENLIKKFKEELSKDKTFKLADDVSDEEKEAFEEASKEVSEEEKATKETEEKKTAEEKVKAEEEAKKKAEEEKETVEAKDKVITMSEKDHKELAEMAAKGAEAAKKLARMEVEKEVDSFVLSEKNTTGKIKPASRDKVIDLILSLNETQATQFREILKDLPEIKDVKLFAESGSGENLDVNDPDHVQLTERAKVYAKEHNMEFAEALREVSKKK